MAVAVNQKIADLSSTRPFSNDIFLLTILFIWTLSCVVASRRHQMLFSQLTLTFQSSEDLRRGLCMLIDFTIMQLDQKQPATRKPQKSFDQKTALADSGESGG